MKSEKEVLLPGTIIGLKWETFTIQAEIVEKAGPNYKIKFRAPNRPKFCRHCGHGLRLSTNGVTGEVVCMTSGCGRRFGFREVIKMIPASEIE